MNSSKEGKGPISTREQREIEAKLLEGVSRRTGHDAAGHGPTTKHNGLKEEALAEAVISYE